MSVCFESLLLWNVLDQMLFARTFGRFTKCPSDSNLFNFDTCSIERFSLGQSVIEWSDFFLFDVVELSAQLFFLVGCFLLLFFSLFVSLFLVNAIVYRLHVCLFVIFVCFLFIFVSFESLFVTVEFFSVLLVQNLK